MLESVQKFACKVRLKRWDLDYDSMLCLLGITRLSTHRQFLKLVLLYKAVNGLTYFPPGIFVPRSSPYLSSGNFNSNLNRLFAHTNYVDCSFVCHYALEQLAQLC